MAIWIIGLIILFFLGSIMGLRINPIEKAQGELRERARKMGLHPRLVAIPDWLKSQKDHEKYSNMLAYYSILVPEGGFSLMRAVVSEQKLNVILGDKKFENITIPFDFIYAVDMQANCVGVYWDEKADLKGEHLDELKQFLQQFADMK